MIQHLSIQDLNVNNCSIASAAITATTSGTAIDCLGAKSIFVFVPVGVVTTADGSNYITFTVTEGATSAAADAVVAGQYIVADSWDRIIDATTEGSVCYAFEFVPTKRYVKVVATETGTTSAIYGAYIVFDQIHQPASA